MGVLIDTCLMCSTWLCIQHGMPSQWLVRLVDNIIFSSFFFSFFFKDKLVIPWVLDWNLLPFQSMVLWLHNEPITTNHAPISFFSCHNGELSKRSYGLGTFSPLQIFLYVHNYMHIKIRALRIWPVSLCFYKDWPRMGFEVPL